MKEYYAHRFYWIFHYTSKNFWYCLAKTLCIVVGLPIYAAMFCVEMVLTFINMLFSWIPVLNMVVMVVCKSLITVVGSTFYLCILPDLKKFKESGADKAEYEVEDYELETATPNDENSDSADV